MTVSFKIVTPVYNSELWIGRCIESVKAQTYRDFHQVIVNDSSTDGTRDHIASATGNDPRFIVLDNSVRRGAGYSHFVGHNKLKELSRDTDVFVHLDGDDWFYDESVLDVLEEAYRDQDTWATYGDYVATDGSRSVCKDWDQTIAPRKQLLRGWCFSQPRTFRKFLWDEIEIADLSDRSGQLLTTSADTAIMSAIIEMAADRVKFVNKILYVYNRDNPLNVDKVLLADEYRCAIEVARKPPRMPLVRTR